MYSFRQKYVVDKNNHYVGRYAVFGVTVNKNDCIYQCQLMWCSLQRESKHYSYVNVLLHMQGNNVIWATRILLWVVYETK